MTRKTFPIASAAVLVLALAGCEAQKSSNPLSPSVAGPIAGVDITSPKLLEPGQGFKFKASQQPIKLLIENASTTGVRPITYIFEVAADSEFQSKLFARAGVLPGDGGRTTVVVDLLEPGRAYFWRARAQDGANTGLFATARFELLPPPQLSAPGPISPINNEQVASRRPTLVVGRSDRNEAVGAVAYDFHIATDQAFTQIVATGRQDDSGAQITFVPGSDLAASLTHFWRARATDGETTSAWNAVQVFRTPAPVPIPAPGPGPAPGAPCRSSSPQSIVECERAKYGHMSSGQLVDLMRAIARSLNANGISGAPFGILRKASGHNCGGYSCDIVCSGSGNSQRQWDVLGDADGAQTPVWSGPHGVPGIRIDVCEIQ